MRKSNLLFILLFVANTVVFAQVEVLPNGNLGIGTDNPQHRLDVVGDMRISERINTATGVIRTTTNNAAISLRVNNTLAGFTGSLVNSNVSFGMFALNSYGSGRGNTAIGFNALDWNEGSSNTALGNNALNVMMTGSFNTAVGANASTANMFGSRNTIIGASAGGWQDDLNNTIVIGYGVMATADNQVRIGNYQVTSVGSSVMWSTVSDGRAQTNIRTNVPGLDFINRLQPVTYNMNLDAMDELMKIDKNGKNGIEMSPELLEQERKAREFKQNIVQTGFLAQDVEKAAKTLGYDFSGVDVDGMGIYGLRYAEFVVPLVKAVQELSAQNEQLIQRIEMLERGSDIGIRNNAVGQPTFNDLFTSGNPAVLHQNVPNPFSQATQINYYLPANVTTAYLCFYDLQGKQLRQITLTQRGAGSEIISSSQFAPGIYLYALIADGQEVDVKRMILTE
jgi:hypothetical protein